MRCELIALIFACAVCHHFVFSQSSSNSNEKEDDVQELFMKLYSKFEDLNIKVEADSSPGIAAIKQFGQQIQKLDDRLKKIENHLIKPEKCEENFKKIEKCEDDLLKFQNSVKTCISNPCIEGRCEVLADGSDYRCTHCPVYPHEKNCEKVNCDQSDKCLRHNNTEYVVFATKMKWETAKRQCESEGMTLAQPKDEASSKFIIDQLRPIYGKDVVKGDERVYFWMGLKYSRNEKLWRWTDGSALGDYHGGWDNLQEYYYGDCGYLNLDGIQSKFWFQRNCLSNFFLVCEKRISVV